MADTRQRLIDAATRAFAEHGVFNASLVEVTRQAGQRNRGAVHYHFGNREGLLVAVLEQQSAFLNRREHQLLEVARARPGTDVTSVLEAIVRPAVELAETGWAGRCYLVIMGELIETDLAALGSDVAAALSKTGGYDVFDLLGTRIPETDEALRNERYALLTAFILSSVARRARADAAPGGRSQLPADRFVENLLRMATAMITTPSGDPG